jgi:hypothetical protein
MKILFVATVMLLIFLSSYLANCIGLQENLLKENIGRKIVIQKDTLLIIDYSVYKNNYKLSNGFEISYELVKYLKKIK